MYKTENCISITLNGITHITQSRKDIPGTTSNSRKKLESLCIQTGGSIQIYYFSCIQPLISNRTLIWISSTSGLSSVLTLTALKYVFQPI